MKRLSFPKSFIGNPWLWIPASAGMTVFTVEVDNGKQTV